MSLSHGSIPDDQSGSQDELIRVRTFLEESISVQVISERRDGVTLRISTTDQDMQSAVKRVRILARPHGVWQHSTAARAPLLATISSSHSEMHDLSTQALRRPAGPPDPMKIQQEHRQRTAIQNKIREAQRSLAIVDQECSEKIARAFPESQLQGRLPWNGWHRRGADGEWQLYSNQDDETFEELPPPHPHSVDLAGLKSGTRYEVSLALAVGEVTYYIIYIHIKRRNRTLPMSG